MGLAHWDDVEPHRRAKGEMDATWQRLGEAAGTKGVGVNLRACRAREAPDPASLARRVGGGLLRARGSGLAWQDGRVHEVRPGDCVIQRAAEHEHTFIAGPEGLEYIVFGTRHPTDLGWLPRSGAVRFGRQWVEGRVDDPWEREAEGPPLSYGEPAERPPNILNIDEVELEEHRGRFVTAPLATKERSDQAGFHWERLDPGVRGSVPHCHSEEEEIFVMLEGEGTLHLWPSPSFASGTGAEKEEIPIRAGHVVARPPATRVSHWFRAGPNGLTMLIYGTRKPNDMCWYPRSNKIAWRGLGVIGRIEVLEYDDGEPDD